MLLKFPSQNDRQNIHQTIKDYADNKISRQQLMTYISGILNDFGINKLSIHSCTVRQVEPVTANWPYPVVIVEAEQRTYKKCPACESNDGRYLAGEAPVITAWCMGCSCIYRKEVPYEKTSKGSRSMDLG